MNKKVVIVPFLLSMFLACSLSVSAVTTDSVGGSVQITPVSVSLTSGDVDPNQTSTCLELKSANLRYRSTDASTNGEVTDLQDFLVATSILKTQVTGYFGLGTFAAVKQFQRTSGLSPTGYVGVLTKAKIKEISCNGVQSISSVRTAPSQADGQEINPQNVMRIKPPAATSTRPVMCTMEARLCPDGRMMARNPSTCEWISTSCLTTPVAPINYQAPAPVSGSPTSVTDGQEINPLNTYNPKTGIIRSSSSPTVCTMVMRLCPNGTPMPRDSNCVWHEEMCTGGTGGGLLQPQAF
jgi:peptidoglycan hydrolase-like protein with peptidoglycan-binding domain